ncbi:MAG: tetratricopeptide repeat protein [Pseudomonadota bacterium]
MKAIASCLRRWPGARRPWGLALALHAVVFFSPAVHGAIEEDPSLAARVVALRAESEAAAESGNLDRAIDRLKLAIEIGVNQEASMRGELRSLLTQRAEQLVARGEQFLKAKDYESAADKFIDSMAYIAIGEARRGLRSSRAPERKAARKALSKAQWDYEHGDYDAARERLVAIEGTTSSVGLPLNLALVYHRLGDERLAAFYLDQYLSAIPDGSQKHDYRITQAVMETGAGVLDPTGLELPLYKKANRLLRREMNAHERVLSGKGDADETGASDNLCEVLEQVHERVGDHAVLLYDLAYCHEAQGRVDEARSFYQQYLDLAPEAADREIVTRHLGEFEQLATTSAEVRDHVTAARHYAVRARYRESIDSYRAAHTLAPSSPLPLWHLTLLHEALGETEQAREYLRLYRALDDANAELITAAQASLALAEVKRERYDRLVATGRDHATGVLGRVFESLVVGTKLNEEYVQREFARAAGALSQALELYPLAWEANLYMSFVLQQTRNYEQARRAMEAVFAHGHEPTYFAFLQIGLHGDREDSVLVDGKGRAYVKLTFDGEGARVRSLAAYNRDQREWYTRWPEGRRDDVLWDEASALPDEFLRSSDAEVATLNHQVKLEVGEFEYFLSPFFLLGDAPTSGRASRVLGNEYARMFKRFGGFEEAALGKERVTFGEVLATVTEVAASVYLVANGYAVTSIYMPSERGPLALPELRASEERAVGRFRQEQLLAIEPRGYKLLPITVELLTWEAW